MWLEIKGYLSNIKEYPYDLYVTLTADNPKLEAEIKEFHPNTKIWKVENRGYDVGPFIDFLHHIDLDKYDLILKIHTKSPKKGMDTTINGLRISRKLWEKLLTRSLVGTHKLFKKNITQFEKNQRLGMIGAKHLITSEDIASAYVRRQINQAMLELGFNIPEKITFLAGTMFFCRSKLIESIKNKYTLNDFALTDGNIKDGTLAHVIERLLGCVIAAQGYEIKGFDTWLSHKLAFQAFCRFIYQNKITNDNRHLIKILKLPVYWRKLV